MQFVSQHMWLEHVEGQEYEVDQQYSNCDRDLDPNIWNANMF